MRIRRIDRDRDFLEVLDVVQACDRAVYGDTDWTENELREQWDEIDLATEAWVAVDTQDRPVGVMHLCERRGSVFIGDGYVHPTARGLGAGTALVRAVEARARERRGEVVGSDPSLHLAFLDGDATAPALLAGEGFHHARSFLRMVIDVPNDLPDAVWPDGTSVRPFDPECDARALYEVEQATFSDEWAYHAAPFDEWATRVIEWPRFDPDLVVTAWSATGLVGFVLGFPKRMGDTGWISRLGVIEPMRGRGLGLALLHESFARFAGKGERTVALGVDTDNPTGAGRLYERAGMRRLWRADVWEKRLDG